MSLETAKIAATLFVFGGAILLAVAWGGHIVRQQFNWTAARFGAAFTLLGAVTLIVLD